MSNITSVAVQGEEGCHSHAAALNCFGENVQVKYCVSFQDAFKLVHEGQVDAALMPFENSLGGCIHENHDNLLAYPSLRVTGEWVHKVEQSLLALRGVAIKDLTKVYSHWQALRQCMGSITKLGMEPVKAEDTAGAARALSESRDKTGAAIASKLAAKLYGLEVLVEVFQDEKENYTRFIIVQRNDSANVYEGDAAAEGKSTLVLKTRGGKAGGLRAALRALEEQGIEVARVEQRALPVAAMEGSIREEIRKQDGGVRVGERATRFPYAYIADVLAHASEDRFKMALEGLKAVTEWVHVAGSYRCHALEEESAEMGGRDTPMVSKAQQCIYSV